MTPEKAREYQRRYRQEIADGSRTRVSGGPKRKGDDLICAHCGATFYRPPANRAERNGRGRANYCNRTCMAAAYVGRSGDKSPRFTERITRACMACGTELHRPRWAWKNKDLAFCNTKCFGDWKSKEWAGEGNPAWRGGKDYYYGANWRDQSRAARLRDGYACLYCSAAEKSQRRALDVHHIVPFRFFGLERHEDANALSNLASLCEQCHTYLERFSAFGTVKTWEELRSRGGNHWLTASNSDGCLPGASGSTD